MTFRIREVSFKNKTINLCSEWYNDNNIFTLITGKNGVGKTQLLTHIVKHYLDILQNENDLPKINIPNRLIVHTNSKFDKFPYYYNKSPKQYKNLTNKSYRAYNNEIFTKLLFNNNLNKQAIYDTLIYLDYLPIIEYRAILSTSFSGKSYLKETMNFSKMMLLTLALI